MNKHNSICDICKHNHTIYAGDTYDHHCIKCYEKNNKLRCICKFCMTGDLQNLRHRHIIKYNSYPQLKKNNCQYRNYFNWLDNHIYAII